MDDPKQDKVDRDLFFILSDKNIQLYVFLIPAQGVCDPLTAFRQHNGDKVSIEISSTDSTFVDVHKNSVSIKKFFLHQVSVS